MNKSLNQALHPIDRSHQTLSVARKINVQAEFSRLVKENESAPPGEKLSEADLLIDPEYDEMLDKEGRELREEVTADEITRLLALDEDKGRVYDACVYVVCSVSTNS